MTLTESKSIKLSNLLKNGIEFSCKKCGACCRGFHEGEVYLYLEDIDRLINFLNLKGKFKRRNFAKKYLKITKDKFYYKDPEAERGKNYEISILGFKFIGEDEHCEFLGKNNECLVHEARPFQCRCFPFWRMMVTSNKNIKEYSKKCPGLKDSLNREGKYYSPESIKKWAEKEYEIEKEYFLKLKENDFDIFKVYPFLPRDLIKG
ncbi:MAG: YkgJ family cysteine cluster protein [Promethearchaeota archaeon]